ncbi:TlpA disulfide reductase family protein [Solwaraspora sp. WMMD1047]|uniref:TlpA family protein disulfide reductase n=1 Tax=Solwaraspora sp. WMMD1047 TaxID=3016102 RepID=UPI00241771FC|nr:TlpA disulfide reductase family protein [Solwaraspora sp. WMMD1047]MDG4828030.1 TlpA disulfide reductase family protein [Solwaraspora sp. WMMD1047]
MRPRSAGPLLALVLLPLALLAAGCSGPSPEPDRRSATAGSDPAPFEPCPKLDVPPVPAGSSAAPAARAPAESPAEAPRTAALGVVAMETAPGGGHRAMPAVTLDCFVGGERVDLGALRGPAVVNLWASWCGPCRKELPALQRLHERAAGAVRVIGVDTRDRRAAAEETAADLGITFPQFFDEQERLLIGLERRVIPVTAFVDGQGLIRHLDESGALDDETLGKLVEQHLGVAVAP